MKGWCSGSEARLTRPPAHSELIQGDMTGLRRFRISENATPASEWHPLSRELKTLCTAYEW